MNSLTTSTSTPTKEQITLDHIRYWMVKFEQALSSYALIDGYPHEYQKGIRRSYREVKETLNKLLVILTTPSAPTQQN